MASPINVVWTDEGDPRIEKGGVIKSLGALSVADLKSLLATGKRRIENGEKGQGQIISGLAIVGLRNKGVQLRGDK